MILIAAALMEELEVGLALCEHRTRLSVPGIRAWKGTRARNTIAFLKTGIGPERSEKSLSLLLNNVRPSIILVLGYGGALDPSLRVGDLLVGDDALLLDTSGSRSGKLDDSRPAGIWELADSREILRLGRAAGFSLAHGRIVTSPHIVGKPEEKRFLRERFRALLIDMETAALARAASRASVPLACVRAVSDGAQDDFLEPFSYDPAARVATRALKLVAAGGLVRRYAKWKENASIARRSLRRFAVWYLDNTIADL